MKINRFFFLYIFLILNGLTCIFLIQIVSNPIFNAFLCLGAILSATLLISWGAEATQFIVSQGLTVALVAFLQILPEFTVEAVISWQAGQEALGAGLGLKIGAGIGLLGIQEIPSNQVLMMANLTGANRLLLGVGWTLIFFTTLFSRLIKEKKFTPHINLKQENILEAGALLLASSYFVNILLKKSISLFDAAILLSMYFGYLYVLKQLPPEGEESKEDLIPATRYLTDIPKPKVQKTWLIIIFVLGLFTMLLVAEPFVESMKMVAPMLGISTFIFVQWIAPFLSEFPEKLTAFYWAKKIRLSTMALLNMISSQVSQWTLLVCMLPIVYSISLGFPNQVNLNLHQEEEIFLSMIMTFYGAISLLKGRFSWYNAVIMFSMWFIQFIYPNELPLLTDFYQNIVKDIAYTNPHNIFFTGTSRMLTAYLFVLLIIFDVLINLKRYSPIQNLKYTYRLIKENRLLGKRR